MVEYLKRIVPKFYWFYFLSLHVIDTCKVNPTGTSKFHLFMNGPKRVFILNLKTMQ